MFEALKEVPAPTAIGAAYQALRLLQQRSSTDARTKRSAITGLTPAEMTLARKLIREITAFEGKPVAKLTDEDVSKYIISLSDAAQETITIPKSTAAEIKRLFRQFDDVKTSRLAIVRPQNGHRRRPTDRSARFKFREASSTEHGKTRR